MNRDLLSGEYKRFPKPWDVIPFTKAFKDMTGGQTKIPKGDYLESGDIPIIDQGQDLIGGYTNERQAVCDIRLPCVVFGDHTKIFKFVTKPFALGADGVKVLSEANNIDPKFAYYFLNTLNLPNVGYSRHFRFLKRTFFPLPPLEEQRRIAAILDKADGVRRKRKEAIRLTEELLKSTFLEMFGDPVTNPKGWEITILRDVCKKVTDGTHHMPKTVEKGTPILRALNIKKDKLETSNLLYISEEDYQKISKRSPLDKGDVLLTCLGTVGNVAIFNEDSNFSLVRNIALLKPNYKKTTSEFLKFILKTEYLQRQIKSRSKQSSQAALYIGEIEQLKIFLPPIELQRKYSNLSQEINDLHKKLEQDEFYQDNLFNSLLQRAFRGEL
ncbi:MAG: restriction endonuclease subunit S [Microcystis aeruginosa G13-07]|nr:restriction endonuclease subunit S [Microcystis aeruginosa G13-11]NCS06481.1 restriction endonuclease subunit S [Microcystis aeruginosa G13-07]